MLQELPREILILISYYLNQIQPSSVIDLACVKGNLLVHLRFFTSGSNFESLLHDDEEQLIEDIRDYSQLLQCSSGYWAVRRLIIVNIDIEKVINQQKEERSFQRQF